MEQTPEEKTGLEMGKNPKSNEMGGGCGCHCHRCGCGMRGCHCGGFWKGLIVGLALFALVICLCDHFCGHTGRGYYGMPMMQSEPSTEPNQK